MPITRHTGDLKADRPEWFDPFECSSCGCLMPNFAGWMSWDPSNGRVPYLRRVHRDGKNRLAAAALTPWGWGLAAWHQGYRSWCPSGPRPLP